MNFYRFGLVSKEKRDNIRPDREKLHGNSPKGLYFFEYNFLKDFLKGMSFKVRKWRERRKTVSFLPG